MAALTAHTPLAVQARSQLCRPVLRASVRCQASAQPQQGELAQVRIAEQYISLVPARSHAVRSLPCMPCI